MKIDDNLTLEQIGADYFVFLCGKANVNMTNVVKLNSSAAWLFEALKGKEFTREEAVSALEAHFDAPVEQLSADLDEILATFEKAGIIINQ